MLNFINCHEPKEKKTGPKSMQDPSQVCVCVWLKDSDIDGGSNPGSPRYGRSLSVLGYTMPIT